MKRFFLLMAVCFFVLPGMAYAAETHTWTDENGVKHIVTITRETQKSAEAGNDSEQSTAADQGSRDLQKQTTKEQAGTKRPETDKQGNRKTDQSLPAGVNPNGSFQFDIDSHKPKF